MAFDRTGHVPTKDYTKNDNGVEQVVEQIKRSLPDNMSPRERYFEFHKQSTEKMLKITKAKNADYSGDSASPFANFEKSAIMAGVATELGILVRLSDKMSRIKSILHSGIAHVKDETVEDTILDACNYLILLGAYLKEKNRDK